MADIIHISDAAAIGLHTMMLLAARHGALMSTRQIADILGVSEAHLAKVLQRLTRQELVVSVRGPKGGFQLGKPADAVSLLTIYEAIDGPLRQKRCLLNSPVCRGCGCLFGDAFESIDDIMRERLEKTTLANSAASVGRSVLESVGVERGGSVPLRAAAETETSNA